MRKVILLSMMLAAVLLAGCLPQTQSGPTPTATQKAHPTPTTGLGLPPEVSVPAVADCTVKTLRPTPGPPAETIYPPITSSDWTKGPADAKVTIVEYGDFQ